MLSGIKSKLEQYFADPNVSRIITHDNWGEDSHLHHITLNKAVRELAVKYRKDVWMLGCTISSGDFIDINVPNGITYTLASFNKPDLFTGIRNIYLNNGCWTWLSDKVPSGDHKFIKIIDGGVDKSNILTGESVSISGPSQLEPGAFIFDGNQDYLTLEGNKYPSFTIAMRVRPDQIRSMDISKMTEYPSNSVSDRNFYLNSNGRVNARVFDGTSKVVTSTTALTSGTWSHIVMTSNGSSLKIYVNGKLENTISAGAGGSISPSGILTLNHGTNQTYAITSNAGYRISDVKVDNNSIGAVSTYTFNNVTSNHTISATFSMDIEVKAYPNPFKDYFNINIVSPNEYLFDISIIDITEKIVFTKTKIPGNTETVINLQHTPPGIYILRLYSKGKRMTTLRIVKY